MRPRAKDSSFDQTFNKKQVFSSFSLSASFLRIREFFRPVVGRPSANKLQQQSIINRKSTDLPPHDMISSSSSYMMTSTGFSTESKTNACDIKHDTAHKEKRSRFERYRSKQTLNLRDQGISDKDIQELLIYVEEKQIVILNLSYNHLRDASAIALADNKIIRKLDLSGNKKIGVKGKAALAANSKLCVNWGNPNIEQNPILNNEVTQDDAGIWLPRSAKDW